MTFSGSSWHRNWLGKHAKFHQAMLFMSILEFYYFHSCSEKLFDFNIVRSVLLEWNGYWEQPLNHAMHIDTVVPTCIAERHITFVNRCTIHHSPNGANVRLAKLLLGLAQSSDVYYLIVEYNFQAVYKLVYLWGTFIYFHLIGILKANPSICCTACVTTNFLVSGQKGMNDERSLLQPMPNVRFYM